MKPITLKMTAFGPYKDTEIIPFSSLHEHGIFVVSGPTGAGKTTIFDAITFALYGAGSGQDRENSMILRSDFADEKQDTHVELEFLVNGEVYKIWRSFNYVGGKKKQEILKLENGLWVNAVEKQQVRPVLQKVEQLLGLTQDQFNQIVMLPQGEYQKMLTSESKEKEAIFRKLFNTSKYEKLVEILKGKRDAAEKQYTQVGMLQTQYINEIKAKLPVRESNLFLVVEQPEVNLYQLHEALDEEKKYYEQQIATLEKQLNESTVHYEQQMKQLNVQKHLNERIKNYKLLLQKLEQLLVQKPRVEEDLMKVELAERAAKIEVIEQSVQKLVKNESQNNDKIQQLKERLKKVEQEKELRINTLTEAKSLAPKREQLLTAIAKNKEVLELYKLAELKKVTVNKLEKDLLTQQQNVGIATTQLAQLKAELQDVQKAITENETGLNDYEQNIDRKAKIESAVDLLKQVNSASQELHNATGQLQAAKLFAEEQANALKALQQQSIQHQASLLVSQLVEGEPCPVCGSTHHENKQAETIVEVDENALNDAAKQADQAMRKAIKWQSDFEYIEKNHQQLLQKCNAEKIHLEKTNEYVDELKQVTEQLNKMRALRQQLQEQKNKRDELQQSIARTEANLQALKVQFDKNQQTYLIEKGQLEQMQLSLPDHTQQLSDIEQAIVQMEVEAQTIKMNIEQAEVAFNKIEVELSQIQTQLQVAALTADELKRDIEAEQLKFNDALAVNGFTEVGHYVSAKMDEDSRKLLSAECQQFQQQLFATEQMVQKDALEIGQQEEQDVTELEAQLSELKEQLQQLRQEETTWKQHANQCAETSEKLKANAEQIELLKEQLTKAAHLYDTIRGQNELKISFERFVQMGYLEQITIAANERLRYLSNNQYFLQPSDRKEGNNAQSGLSLDVLDSFTGQARDVKSLSGGEKFNASLSLALGMADVIQSVQGSVHIETMFIDEGFGTLDEESLQKAIETLIDLQKSGRIIGVISHVAELKAAIPAILEVQKLKEGYSKTSIHIK